MENVPQVHSKKNMPDFQKWIDFLESKGYANVWQDLNAKDYGIPQNRNRCFMVSMLDSVDDFHFPKGRELEYSMNDFLETEVEEKYYIKSAKADELIKQLVEKGELKEGTLRISPHYARPNTNKTAFTICSSEWRGVCNQGINGVCQKRL